VRHAVTVPRARDLGITIGLLPAGPTCSILDVPGVGVGHATVWRDEADPPSGRGVARTGITVVDPGGDTFREPLAFGSAVLNGAGESTGLLTGAEWGLLESPIFMTSTMQLGRVYDAACELMIEANGDIGVDDVAIPVVAECDDSFLNDARCMQVDRADVRTAWDDARASVGTLMPPAEGAVGSGTGMSCLGYKGGIGTASRVLTGGHTLGAVVMTNFGERDRLTIDGIPAGRLLADPATETAPDIGPGRKGSCIVVLATDGPLDAASCARVARRAGLGLARTGSVAYHGSGEIFMAFSTGNREPRGGRRGETLGGKALDEYFAATVEVSEEAVLNSLFQATTVVGRSGNVSYGMPVDRIAELVTRRALP
jgi:D-aminopeptidase